MRDMQRQANARVRRFSKGEILYCQDGPPQGWFELVEGFVRLCRYYGDGRRQVIAFPVPGDVFGFDSDSRTCSAEAIVPGKVIWHAPEDSGLHTSRVVALAGPHPALERALHALESNLELFSYPTAMQRLCAFLLRLQERLHLIDHVPLPMSRLDIAEHLGLTMHTISRSMAQLARDGLIEYCSTHGVWLRDRGALAAYAGIEDHDLMEDHGLAAAPYSLVA